jgi:regulator of protease activity HflC (stomatin/prohibitin superfamily)
MSEQTNEVRSVFRAYRGPIIATCAILLAIFVKCMFTAEVPAGHVALVYNWGKLDTSYTHGPGLMWKAPWPAQSVEYFPVRLTVQQHKGEAADSKQQLVDTEISVQLVVNPKAAPMLRKEIGSYETVLSTVVDNNIPQATKAESTQHDVQVLVTDREKLRRDIATHLQQLIDNTLAEKNITDAIKVVQVGVTQFDFKDGFVRSIDDKVKAQQEAFTAAIQKRITEIDADANARRTEILAAANADATRDINDAQTYAIQILGDAAATDGRLGLYEAIQNWNNHVPGVNMGAGANIMLTAPAAGK